MKTTHAKLEALETRRLFAATADLVDGVLEVHGTSGKDAINFSLDPADDSLLLVKLKNTTLSFELNEIESITVDGDGGNDRITVSEANGIIIAPFTFNGGAGNDTIVAGSGDDVLNGNAGNDKLTGGAGDDTIDGGAGNDQIVGGLDNDYIIGGKGNDKLTGSDGDDSLDAGAGKDKLDGGNGDDNLDGGNGKDKITTGDGEDSVAVDDSNRREIKDRSNEDDRVYTVTEFDDLEAGVQELHEGAVPGSDVFRVEVADDFITLYYHFGDDPEAYKTVLQVVNGEIELYSREVSIDELRSVATQVFNERHPNLQIVSLFQTPGGVYDVRYRDEEGVIQRVTIDDLTWTLDDADRDQDNDGINDPYDGEHDGQDNQQNDDGNEQDDDQPQGDGGQNHNQNEGGDDNNGPDGGVNATPHVATATQRPAPYTGSGKSAGLPWWQSYAKN